LQTLFLVENGKYVNRVLRKAGFRWDKDPGAFMETFYGQGMRSFIPGTTKIGLNDKSFDPSDNLDPVSDGGKLSRTFYIPAQRVLVINDGWPRPFSDFDSTYPFVVRDFSDKILRILETGPGSKGGSVFPQEGRIKAEIRTALNDAIYHDSRIEIGKKDLRNRLVLMSGTNELPIMTWSAGQREFTPLLLGLYHLLPPTAATKKADIDTVIIEEPETGLHPRAIQSVMMSLLELATRGYRVIVSTHSPDVLHYAWALAFICRKAEGHAFKPVFADIISRMTGLRREAGDRMLEKSAKVFFAKPGPSGSRFKEISSLDAFDQDQDVADWGGITSVAAHVQDFVAEAANR
jgi:hypothetical protein